MQGAARRSREAGCGRIAHVAIRNPPWPESNEESYMPN